MCACVRARDSCQVCVVVSRAFEPQTHWIMFQDPPKIVEHTDVSDSPNPDASPHTRVSIRLTSFEDLRYSLGRTSHAMARWPPGPSGTPPESCGLGGKAVKRFNVSQLSGCFVWSAAAPQKAAVRRAGSLSNRLRFTSLP